MGILYRSYSSVQVVRTYIFCFPQDNRSLAADEVLYSFIKTVTVLANISQNDQTNPLFTDSNFGKMMKYAAWMVV